MADVHAAHTADLDSATLEAAHALLDAAFDGAFSDHDWDHALGGLHALAWEGSELVGHASVVQRRLLHAGRTLRAGYVEGVGVRASRRGRGYASALLDAVERVLRGAYDAGALSSTDAAVQLYASRGWQRWEGPTSTLSPAGIIPTKDDDGGLRAAPGGPAGHRGRADLRLARRQRLVARTRRARPCPRMRPHRRGGREQRPPSATCPSSR